MWEVVWCVDRLCIPYSLHLCMREKKERKKTKESNNNKINIFTPGVLTCERDKWKSRSMFYIRKAKGFCQFCITLLWLSSRCGYSLCTHLFEAAQFLQTSNNYRHTSGYQCTTQLSIKVSLVQQRIWKEKHYCFDYYSVAFSESAQQPEASPMYREPGSQLWWFCALIIFMTFFQGTTVYRHLG